MTFSAAETKALQAIQRALGAERVVLIGAAALREFGYGRWRTTFDLDLTVALDQEDFPGPLE